MTGIHLLLFVDKERRKKATTYYTLHELYSIGSILWSDERRAKSAEREDSPTDASSKTHASQAMTKAQVRRDVVSFFCDLLYKKENMNTAGTRYAKSWRIIAELLMVYATSLSRPRPAQRTCLEAKPLWKNKRATAYSTGTIQWKVERMTVGKIQLRRRRRREETATNKIGK